MMSGMLFNRTLASWDDVEISQYTGLKDSGGRDVYEGDLLYKGRYFPVEWSEHRGGWVFREGENIFQLDIHQAKHFKVFGNIYEAPELLKGKP